MGTRANPVSTRVVLDTNVVVSALLFRGPTSVLHAVWKRRTIELLATDVSLAELARVLGYRKFHLTAELVTGLMATEVLPYAAMVMPNRHPPACRDRDDDEFLWCARDGGAEALVTGDPDLLALRPSWEGVMILAVAEALSRFAPDLAPPVVA